VKKYAQIIDNKAYWVFETESDPVFAPNIFLVDITDKPDVQEGWEYDVMTNTFSGVPRPPQPTLKDIGDNQIVMMNAIADLYIQLSKLQQPGQMG
jgi:hypothetical protein